MLNNVVLRWDDAHSPMVSAGIEVLPWLGNATPSARSPVLPTQPSQAWPVPIPIAAISIGSAPATSVLPSLPSKKSRFDGYIARVAATASVNDKEHYSNMANSLRRRSCALLNVSA